MSYVKLPTNTHLSLIDTLNRVALGYVAWQSQGNNKA